jgi:hypothetical protein
MFERLFVRQWRSWAVIVVLVIIKVVINLS